MRQAAAILARQARDLLAGKRLRWQSQRRGRALALACLAEETWLDDFRATAPPGKDAYSRLFRYFVAGFLTYRSPLGAYADYVGLASYNGAAMDRLEGFSRLAPLVAAWLHGGRGSRIDLAGRTVDLRELLYAGLIHGTDPASPEHWGPIRHWSQAIVEATDIALVLWLTRPLLWDALTHPEQMRIADWLRQVNHKHIPDNNWHLFVVQVNAVLRALGMPHDAEEMAGHYRRAKSFHRGGGWFRDGERTDKPGFDYYNAWGFHYHLQWIDRIAPDLDGSFIAEAFRAFLTTYRYLLGPEGFPILGRSACYRLAATAPLIQAQTHHGDQIPPGQARRALDTSWSYFIRLGALQGGNVTQGYLRADSRLLENYSGPASCLWSLRSLVSAFALPDDHVFWNATPRPLPVEEQDYRIEIAAPGWIVTGEQATRRITLTTDATDTPALDSQPALDRFLEWFTLKPRRPDNIRAKYQRPHYHSDAPYGQNMTMNANRASSPSLPHKP